MAAGHETNGTAGRIVGLGIARTGIAVGLLALALKTAAWWLTGSAALYSDALESVVNIATAVMAFAALRFAARPADANHPFGHEKAELFAAVIEGGLIVAASALILQHAWVVWWHPEPLARPGTGIVLNLAATLVNLGWAAVLFDAGRRVRSAALRADAWHLFSDVLAGLGAVAAVALVMATGERRLDPLIAAAIALYILGTGFVVIRASVGGLMDEAPDAETIARIRALVARHAAGAIEAHDLRTRHAGRLTFLQFHLVVPGSMTVADAHAICDRVEAALRAEMDGLATIIHVEPEGKAKHHGIIVL